MTEKFQLIEEPRKYVGVTEIAPDKLATLKEDMALFFHERGFTLEEMREAERWALVDQHRAARCYAALANDIRAKRRFAAGINERIRASIAREQRNEA